MPGTDKNTGALDYVIPHYFVFRALQKWTENPARAYAGFIVTVPLAILSFGLYLAKGLVGVTLSFFALPIVGLANKKYNETYREMEGHILDDLQITKEDPTVEKMFEVTEEVQEKIEVQEKKEGFWNKVKGVVETVAKTVTRKVTKHVMEPVETVPFKIAFNKGNPYWVLKAKDDPNIINNRVESYKELFSEIDPSQHGVQLVKGRDDNYYIKVYTPEIKHNDETNEDEVYEKKDETFFIKVDKDDAKATTALKDALHLNMFGITSQLGSIEWEGKTADTALEKVEQKLSS